MEIDRWLPGFRGQSNPGLVRCLGRQPLEPEGGHQADDPLRHEPGYLGQIVELPDIGFGPGIEASSHSVDQSATVKPVEVIRRNTERNQVARCTIPCRSISSRAAWIFDF